MLQGWLPDEQHLREEEGKTQKEERVSQLQTLRYEAAECSSFLLFQFEWGLNSLFRLGLSSIHQTCYIWRKRSEHERKRQTSGGTKSLFSKEKMAIAQVSRLKVFAVYKLGTGSHPGLIKWIQVTGDMLNLTRLPKCEQIHSAVFPEHISLLEFSLYAIFSQNHMLHFSELKSLRLTFTNAIFAPIGTFTPTNLVTPASCPGRAEQSAAVSSAFRLFFLMFMQRWLVRGNRWWVVEKKKYRELSSEQEWCLLSAEFIDWTPQCTYH